MARNTERLTGAGHAQGRNLESRLAPSPVDCSHKRDCKGYFFRALLFVALLTLAGTSYETVASRMDLRHLPRPGRLVDVGKFRLNLYCAGQGGPTIVLEAGLADSLDQ